MKGVRSRSKHSGEPLAGCVPKTLPNGLESKFVAQFHQSAVGKPDLAKVECISACVLGYFGTAVIVAAATLV
jgi:hypothetical protein